MCAVAEPEVNMPSVLQMPSDFLLPTRSKISTLQPKNLLRIIPLLLSLSHPSKDPSLKFLLNNF